MVHGSPQDGHAVGDGDGAFKVERLGRDMSLVMIQGQNAVITADGSLTLRNEVIIYEKVQALGDWRH